MTNLNRTLYYSLILFIIPVMVFGSCKKEEKPEVVIEEPAPVNRSPLLVNKIWQLAGLYMDEVQQPVTVPVTVEFQSLSTIFQTEGTYRYRTDGGNYDELWKWNDNQTKIIIAEGTEFEEVWNVLGLTASQLTLKRGQGPGSEQRVFFPN